MGKHDMGAPINDTLEKHYQDKIKALEEKLEAVVLKNRQLDMELERKDIELKVAEAKTEEFSKALAEMTVKAVLGGVK